MSKTYHIELDGKRIGTTQLESADPPMGVVFGQIDFVNIDSGYDFFKEHCLKSNSTINSDIPEDRFLDTQVIEGLKVFSEDKIEIKGEAGTSITGFDEEGFEISILGIPYPFYEDQFPNHVADYKNNLNTE